MSQSKSDAFTECYVAFLDILGVRALVKRSHEQPEIYRNLVSALVEAKNLSVFRGERREIESSATTKWSLQVQAFSDCVVLFIPTESKMLSWLLASIRRLHDRMVRLGVCLRGAMTIGGMHWSPQWSNEHDEKDKNNGGDGIPAEMTSVAFGPGLVTAYELENGCAVYPRILVANEFYDRIEKDRIGHAQTFPLANGGNLIDFIRQDFDGLWHFDVLHRDIIRRDVICQLQETDEQGHAVVRTEFDETSYEERLREFGRFVVHNLEQEPKEPILAKYQWCARYYNEKARAAGTNKIPIFIDEVPANRPILTITQSQ